MDKIFLSVRLTETFFSQEELKKVKSILKTYENKSEFLRDVIKIHLNNNDFIENKQENFKINKEEFIEVKNMIEKNNSLLKKLTSNNIKVKSVKSNDLKDEKTYNEDEQIKKTEKILDLVDQF